MEGDLSSDGLIRAALHMTALPFVFTESLEFAQRIESSVADQYVGVSDDLTISDLLNCSCCDALARLQDFERRHFVDRVRHPVEHETEHESSQPRDE